MIKGVFKYFLFPSVICTIDFETEQAWGVWGWDRNGEMDAKKTTSTGRLTAVMYVIAEIVFPG